jgi:hypothetical protein
MKKNQIKLCVGPLGAPHDPSEQCRTGYPRADPYGPNRTDSVSEMGRPAGDARPDVLVRRGRIGGVLTDLHGINRRAPTLLDPLAKRHSVRPVGAWGCMRWERAADENPSLLRAGYCYVRRRRR